MCWLSEMPLRATSREGPKRKSFSPAVISRSRDDTTISPPDATAAMREAYVGDDCDCGMFLFGDDDMNDMVLDYHVKGYQLGVHAIGDAATDQTLTARVHICANRVLTNFFPLRITTLFWFIIHWTIPFQMKGRYKQRKPRSQRARLPLS